MDLHTVGCLGEPVASNLRPPPAEWCGGPLTTSRDRSVDSTPAGSVSRPLTACRTRSVIRSVMSSMSLRMNWSMAVFALLHSCSESRTVEHGELGTCQSHRARLNARVLHCESIEYPSVLHPLRFRLSSNPSSKKYDSNEVLTTGPYSAVGHYRGLNVTASPGGVRPGGPA